MSFLFWCMKKILESDVKKAIIRNRSVNMKKEEIRRELFDKKDEKYREFNRKLTPSNYEMIGGRLPILRNIAKKMAENAEESLKSTEFKYFEEVLLYGLTICYIKRDSDIKLKYLDEYLKYADNWEHIDSVVMTLKFKQSEKAKVKEKAEEYIVSQQEFVARTGVILIMKHFLGEKDVSESLKTLEKADTSKYYISMAVAWCLCEAVIKAPQVAVEYLKNGNIDDTTLNRAIDKCRDSFRISDDLKKELKEMKKK